MSAKAACLITCHPPAVLVLIHPPNHRPAHRQAPSTTHPPTHPPTDEAKKKLHGVVKELLKSAATRRPELLGAVRAIVPAALATLLSNAGAGDARVGPPLDLLTAAPLLEGDNRPPTLPGQCPIAKHGMLCSIHPPTFCFG